MTADEQEPRHPSVTRPDGTMQRMWGNADSNEGRARTEAGQIAQQAAVRFGRPPGTVEHIRTGTNALYRCDDIALRVAPAGYDEVSLAHQLALVTHLTQRGFPTPAQVGGLERIDGRLVTAWEWAEPRGEIDHTAVGALARQFHRVTRDYTGPVPAWDPLARARERLATAALTTADEAMLHRHMERLSAAVEPHGDTPMGVVHGDLHDGNVIATDQGLLLIDFERFSLGPLEWDLAQRAAGARFFPDESRHDGWDRFQTGYGHLPLSQTFDTLVTVRAFVMTTWLLSLPLDETVEREREVRLRYWRAHDRGDAPTRAGWSPRGELSGHPGWAPI